MAGGRDFLGGYQLVKLIRAGTVCQVWEGIKPPHRHRIALKVLRQEYKDDKREIDQLRNEAECGKSFDHENVVTIYEFNNDHHLAFIAMELFNAYNLKQEIREFPERLVYYYKDIVRQCGSGLAHVHDKGWLHCDIKPDNFLMNDDIKVKVIDFSIAQRLKKRGGLLGMFGNRNRAIQGTRSYMAPEQILRKPLDEKSDIYAFGCVMFELMAGKPPFSGNNPNDLLNKHLKAPVPHLSAINNRASSDLSALITKMMSKDPSRRPDSMRAVVSEFNTIQIYRAGNRPDPPKEREKSE